MLFNIGKQSIPTPQDEYNKMFGDNKNESDIQNVDVELLDEIKNQHFIFRKEKAEQLVDSIKLVGILEPLLVRKKKNGRYDIIAGRHRATAAKMAGLKTVPVIVKDVSVDIAKFILLSTNTDRNNEYTYSELAYAYKEQLELLEKLGNNATTSKLAENHNTNRKQIYRYIRLTYLNKQLLKMVDTGQIPFTVAVDISYFSIENQNILFRYLLNNNEKISLKQRKKLKAYQDKELTFEALDDIFSEEVIEVIPTITEQENVDNENMSTSQNNNEDITYTSNEQNKESTNEIDNNFSNITLDNELIELILMSIYNTEYIYEYYVFHTPTPSEAIIRLSSLPILSTYDDYKITSDATGLTIVSISSKEEYVISYRKIDKTIRKNIRENCFDSNIVKSVLSKKLSSIA